MDTPTRAFLRAIPNLKRVAAEAGIDYGYLRHIAAGTQDAGVDVRRKLVAWGEANLPEIQKALRTLRRTLPLETTPE
jgi:hypothetical protein